MIDPSFQRVNRLFVLSFKYENGRESYKRYYLPTVQIKDYNVMIDGRNFFDQPVKTDLKTYDNIHKITTGQGDDCKIGCLLDYPYFKEYYILIAIGLRKQQKLDAAPKKYNKLILLRMQTEQKMQQCFYYWRRERNYFRFFKRDSEIIIILF